MHGVCNCKYEVDYCKESYKVPALQRAGEGQEHNNCCKDDSGGKPGFELAESGIGLVYNVPHDRIIERVKDTRKNHDYADC